jgi:hemerythrin-like domain-containing protein
MVNLTTIQRQHSEILKLTRDLLMYDSVQKVTENAFSLSLLLANLSGKLSIHLSGEDKYIYPFLMSKEDKIIQETSQRFASEMGSLAEVFTNYKTRYLFAFNIKNTPIDFIQESKRVMKAIMERIDKEEKFLYPLV